MAKTPHCQCKGPRFDSWPGNNRSHMLQLRTSAAKQINNNKYWKKKKKKKEDSPFQSLEEALFK